MMFLRRTTALKSLLLNSPFVPTVTGFCSKASTTDKERENERQTTFTDCSGRIHLSPLFSDKIPHCDTYDIELVDNDTWQVSSGLVQAWRGSDDEDIEAKSLVNMVDIDDDDDDLKSFEDDPDFDELDNMRIRGDLFYKLDKDSKEFEEYNLDFHRKKSSKTTTRRNEDKKESEKKEVSKRKSVDVKESKSKEASRGKSDIIESKREENPSCYNGEKLMSEGGASNVKKVRTPTYNQLTGPYHEPFCLDIFISNASVRACIVHRVTSKVVAVAHSISKDMKFDLGSTRNANTCVAVGGILAQRALADDIHDVVYTPRKGDKLEGKLRIVLQAVIDNGVNVKVKLKQRKNKKTAYSYPSAAA